MSPLLLAFLFLLGYKEVQYSTATNECNATARPSSRPLPPLHLRRARRRSSRMVLPGCTPRLRRRGRRPAPPRPGLGVGLARSPRRRRRRHTLSIALPQDPSREKLLHEARTRRLLRSERESLLGGIQGRATEGEGGAQTGARGEGADGPARLVGVRVPVRPEEQIRVVSS